MPWYRVTVYLKSGEVRRGLRQNESWNIDAMYTIYVKKANDHYGSSKLKSAELDTMFATMWSRRIEPVPVFENDVLFWTVPEFEIKEENLACAKGLVVVKLLENKLIELEDLFFLNSLEQY
jgi:hypothetical protein